MLITVILEIRADWFTLVIFMQQLLTLAGLVTKNGTLNTAKLLLRTFLFKAINDCCLSELTVYIQYIEFKVLRKTYMYGYPLLKMYCTVIVFSYSKYHYCVGRFLVPLVFVDGYILKWFG